ncbi:carboxypeptidase-like regulatory domain-containing protein [Marilutibacter chinensis]|uniref:Carboxypeptidase-like regulatory domain-containing protein n=1 Tax=Marilutibacter chinensis TaxID=2912247 RepID=A0ABS9HSW6_9GAMM|nr:carboxypeptidase-like regulatory domain-containing protein [Lysobacter chinensis]MCF7221768.1 carboxypeptidase-like regulatory domain-containing protein [Lysobacter chinensis]MCF7223704.1 carboxypeptidase-like regulatory domain-containing protein [Lysobacter chinensis]
MTARWRPSAPGPLSAMKRSAITTAIALLLASAPALANGGQTVADAGRMPGAAAASPPAVPGRSDEAGAYQDRLIDPDALPDTLDDDPDDYDDSGLPRSFHAELAYSHGEFGGDTFREYGISAGGFRETAHHGTLSLQASLSRRDDERRSAADDDDWRGAATLWQRNLAMPGQWLGDNGLGVLNTPTLPLQRSQYRFFLPSVAFAGASSEWRNDASGLRLIAGGGRIGHYSGTRLQGFELDEGHVGTLGTEWRWAPGWTGSATLLSSDGRLVPGNDADDQGQAVIEPVTSHAFHAATAWSGARDRLQLNLLASGGDAGAATGAWLDASAARGGYSHHYGVFHLGEDLAWGSYPINNDARGGYYRIAYQFARWSWNAGIDRIDSISGDSFEGSYANAYLRYQASRQLGYGASLSLRDGSDDAVGAQLFLDRNSDWGSSRLQLDVANTDGAGSDSWQLSFDQAFPVKLGRRLSAALSHGELSYDGRPATRSSSLSFYGGLDLTDRLSIDGQTRWVRGDGPDALRGFNANLGVNWRLDTHWTLSATLYQNQGTRRSPFQLDPLANDPLFIALPRERSAFLVLRYERGAGRPRSVLGGAPGTASGRVAGSVFLDDNGDRVRNAAEDPAANLTVILDGRYAVRTDSAGRFEFPDVAVGSHTLTVLPDNLPLPWYFDDGEALRTIEVDVRDDLQVDIPAARPR